MKDLGLRVLLIEDNAGYASMVRAMLGGRGAHPVHVTHADRLATGVSRARSQGADVALLDLYLPDAKGVETLIRFREQAPEPPVVVLTASGDATMELRALEAGAEDYLTKLEADGDRLFRTLNHATARHRRVRQLEDLSRRDPLTGLLNRHGFEEAAHRELHAARCTGEPVTVLFLDVDGLKAINDTFGHAEGDAALRACGSAMRAAFRASDVLGRIGGDELAVVLRDGVAAGEEHYGDRLRGALAAARERAGLECRPSVSLGAATSAGQHTLEELLERADRRLYRGRRARASV